MSTPNAKLITRLNDQSSSRANNVAKALGAIAASESKMKSSIAALKRQAAAEREAASAASRHMAAQTSAYVRLGRIIGRASGHLTNYQALALGRRAAETTAGFEFLRGYK